MLNRDCSRRGCAFGISALVLAGCVWSAMAADKQAGLVLRVWEFDGGSPQIPDLVPGQLPNVVREIKAIKLGDGGEAFGAAPENFISEIAGYLHVEQAGAYEFHLTSDDGSKLWIDGKLLIDHDGAHAPESRDGTLDLTAGDHALRLKHYQGAAGAVLTLEWRKSGDAKFAAISEAALLHDALAEDARKTAPGRKRIIAAQRRGLPGDGAPVVGDHPGFARAPGAPGLHMELSEYLKGGLLRATGAASKLNRPAFFYIPVDALDAQGTIGVKITEGSYAGQYCIWPAGGQEGWRLFPDELPGRMNGAAMRFNSTGPTNLTPSAKPAFEILGVQSVTNGLTVIFSAPLDPRCGWEADSFLIEQWPFDLVEHRPLRDGTTSPVKSASVSADRTRVFLEIPSLNDGKLIYLRALPPMYSESGQKLWSTEVWYMLNNVASERTGVVRPRPDQPLQNTLSDAEKAEGWKLLFDGKSTAGWHGFGKQPAKGWEVVDGALVRTGAGGDIVTDEEFGSFELKMEWRISAAGNSGVMYHVKEEQGLRWPWETGPEMQVLDNAEHPDGRNPLTSAGSNYALYAPPKDVTRPVGLFNEARIVVRGPHVEHWLNGEKLVEYELWSDAWKKLVAGSKFKSMPRYGQEKSGSIVLQDHGDRVWYRNIKIKPLKD